jgi:polyhydroxyalkanoate synthesis regulator phasin
MGTAMQQGGQVAALLSPDQVRGIVSDEVDRIVRRLGFARADELASLRREVSRLEMQVAGLEEHIATLGATAKANGKKDGKKSKGKKD